MEIIKADICVVGAGSGGLSVAVAAAQMGANVILVEKGKMGGDCLNTGCIPSKALLSFAEQHKLSGKKGMADFKAAYKYVHSVIKTIAPHDSVERMESLGIMVIKGVGRFVKARTLQVGKQQIKAKRFVIAAGSSPGVPPVKGLKDVPFFTNDTIFENKDPIKHLVIIGGGPIGLEMALAHRRLGAEVTVLEKFSILPKDDPDAADVLRKSLKKL